MLEILSKGFLGFRGDLLSDLLIVALFLIVPALLVAVWAARAHRPRLHRALMWSVLGVVIAYVIVYESSMLAQGGMDFLRTKIRMSEAAYFSAVAMHVALAVLSLAAAVMAVRKGTRVFRAVPQAADSETRAGHRRVGYAAFLLLVVSVVTGVAVYYLTFVYDVQSVPDGATASGAPLPASTSVLETSSSD